MKKLLLILFFFTLSFYQAQIVNAYAKVASINGAQTTLIVNNVNEASHTFTVGGRVIIMQMQDDAIGTNTTNASTFGDVGVIQSAGLYEIGIIASRMPATGTPTSIVLSNPLSSSFNTGSNSSLQIITFRDMGANYTTTANITGLAWNGNVGGVIAFETSNTLTLNHSVIADGIGFLGGVRSNDNGGPICVAGNSTNYISNSANYGGKGEGIYKSLNANFNKGRAKILSGGGGGGDHNAGGGGGSNYSTGGQGGNGYNNCTTFPAGGLGGVALSSYISGSRIFMGGGGGGGQQNNTVGSAGGNGGGIIIIKANTLITNTLCASAIRISANGLTAANVGNDGAGGGGAAGSILLQVNTFSTSATCPLSVNSNGGNGGNVTNSGAHAGGGGGGQGAIVYPSSQPTVNVTSTATNGTPGSDNSSGLVSAGPGGGANNGGVIPNSPTPLPIELISFEGTAEYNKIKLTWSTATETDNDYFIVERSADGIHFTSIGNIDAAGNSTSIKNYSLYDTKPYSTINYYRLKQTDFDESYTYSKIISITSENETLYTIYPNPASTSEPIYVLFEKNQTNSIELNIYDITGKLITTTIIKDLTEDNQTKKINTGELAKGIYMICFYDGIKNQVKKLVIN